MGGYSTGRYAVAPYGTGGGVVVPPSPVGGGTNRAGGRRRQATASATWEPAIVPAPATLVRATAVERATASGSVTMRGSQPTYTTSEATIPRARHRLIVGNVDVTWFRGIATPEPTYQLVEPLLYGPAVLTFPQIAPVVEELGVGALRWLDVEKRVVIQRVGLNEDGDEVVIGTDYKGIVIGFDISGGKLNVQVGGEASGRAALQNRQQPIFNGTADLGRYAYGLIRDLGLSFTPHLGPTTGIKLGRFGGLSMVDYANELCARGWTRDGSQWTIMPNSRGKYHMVRKDTETIDATVYLDDTRVVGDLRRDLAEEPNRIFATGVTPEGMRVRNGVYPGLRKGSAPAYPMDDHSPFGVGTTDDDTDSGDGVSVLINRLQATGYLSQRDAPGGYDADVVRAVKALQEEAADGPTFISGTMNPATWNALFDIGVTGFSLRWSHIEPMAQAPRVRKWRRSGSGAVIAANPRYKASAVKVDTNVDFGTGFTRDQMREWAHSELQISDNKNWVGTIRVPTGALIDGEHVPGTAITPADVRSARRIKPGMNLWAPLFDGGTLFHVSATSVDAEGIVTLMVDTRARDALKVWQIIARNRESRKNPARLWLQEHRSSTTLHDSITEWDEIGGEVQKTALPGGQWTVFETVAGQEGTVRSLRMKLSTPTEFVVAVFGKPIYASRLARLIGNPLTRAGSRRFARESIRDALDEKNILLYVAGSDDAPCGYYPGVKGEKDDNGDLYTLTGRWEDDAGFSYHTFEVPVLYVAVWTANDATLPAGRIMLNQLETGV